MHPTDKKQKFIELRVQGQTLTTIAQTLDVPRSTVWRWHNEEEDHINELQLMAQEEIEHEFLLERDEDLKELHQMRMVLHHSLIDKLSQRADHLSIKELFLYLNLTRSEIEHHRIKPFEKQRSTPSGKSVSKLGSVPATPANDSLSLDHHAATTATIIPLPAPVNEPAVPTPSVPQSLSETGRQETAVDSKMVLNGTNPKENGTAANNDGELPSAPLASAHEAPSTSGPQSSPERKMVLNGTFSMENGTAQPVQSSNADSPQVSGSKPAEANPSNKSDTPSLEPEAANGHTPGPGQISTAPPASTPPPVPERIVGHKIDPSKIIGRKTPPPSVNPHIQL